MSSGPFRRDFFARLTVALWLCACAGVAVADDYADVAQLLKNGQLTQALARAEQYLAAKPRDPQMRFFKGVIQSESGRATDAIATFARLTEDYPELPEPYNNLAVLYAGQNRNDKALEALEMAVRTNPAYATAHENLGDIHARLAAESYARAAQLEPANATAPSKLALIRSMLDPTRRPGATAPPAAPAATAAPAR